MSADQSRAEILKLLEQLGAEDDSLALAAAREVHRRVVVEGNGWDVLLVPEPEEMESLAAPVPDEAGLAAEVQPASISASEADMEILESLLQRTDISAQTREELEGLRADAEDGSFNAMDSKYLRALDERLRQS